MKYLFIVIFCFCFGTISAQLKQFGIKGNVVGAEKFNYVYIFDNNYKLIDHQCIKGGRFSITGEYSVKQGFGEVPFVKIFLSNEDTFDLSKLNSDLSDFRNYNCNIILRKDVEVTYYTDKKWFEIKGGVENELQNQFNKPYWKYRMSRDSAYLAIDKKELSPDEKKELRLKIANQLFGLTLKETAKVIQLHSDSEVTLFNFSTISISDHGEHVQLLFNGLSERLRNSEYGQYQLRILHDQIKREALLAKPPYVVDMKFPDFELPDYQNIKTKLSDRLGKYALIDFWASWCGPCRQETPNLIKAFNDYHSKGFQVLTISIDSESDRLKWLKAIADDGMKDLTNLFNGGDLSGLALELKVVAIPTNYLVDDQGKIIAMNLRGAALSETLEKLFK